MEGNKMAIWDESKHPRNEKGQFTYSEGGILKGGIEKTENNEGLLGKLLGGYSLGEIKDILFSVISTAAPSIIKTGLTIAQMKNFIKLNNLEKELIKKIENIKTNKETQKTNPEKDKNSFVSLGSNHNNSTSSKVKLNNKIKETPKDILYASSNFNNQLKLKQDEYKSKLLDILGNHATQGDILYGKPEELEEKVKQYGLNRKMDKIKQEFYDEISNLSNTLENNKALKNAAKFINDPKNELRNVATDKLSDYIKKHPEIKEKLKNVNHRISSPYIGRHYNDFFNDLARKAYGENTAGMLDLAHKNQINPNYTKDAIKLNNYNDRQIIKYKNYLKNKIEKQYKDYTNIDPKNVDGYYFKSNSNPSMELAQTKEIKEFIKQHKKEIINNTLSNKNECQSIEFPTGDWYYAVHYADIIDTYFDKNGNLHLIMSDTNDYNINEDLEIIKAGRDAMLKDELKPKYVIWEILIKKDEFDKI